MFGNAADMTEEQKKKSELMLKVMMVFLPQKCR
jgi:hypothetical protein